MKKIYALLILLACCIACYSQTFTDTDGAVIHDPPVVENFPITASGLPAVADTDFGVVKVCCVINHTYVGDLDVRLQAPDGTIIELSNNHGGSGDNYGGTCFAEDAVNGEIGSAYAPFNGTYYPDDHLNDVNNGQDPNGVWTLVVLNEAPIDTGLLINWSITFADNPPPDHAGGPCTTSNAFSCQCPDSTQECDLLPDMINSSVYLAQDWSEHAGYISQGIATPNIGYGPMEVHGTGECFCDTVAVDCASTCPDGSNPKENVLQTIYHKSGAAMSKYTVSAGTMSYHPSHGHIHIDDWTYNTLRIRGPEADATKWPVLGEGAKQSFCLINLGTCYSSNGVCVDDNGNIVNQPELHNGGLGSVTGCGEDQGIYVGSYDVYGQGFIGQQIYFNNLCNGEYYVVSITDPHNNMKEINEDNNWAINLISLSNQQGNCCTSAFHADTTSGEAPFQVMFIDSTVPIAQSWLWDFGDGYTSTEQFPQHVYNIPGIYSASLSVVTSAGCFDTISHTDYITVTGFATGVKDIALKNDLQLKCYPNPFSESTQVDFKLDAPVYLHLRLTDVTGKVVKILFEGWHASGSHTISIDAQDLPSGIYMVEAEAGGKLSRVKLVKMESGY